MGGKIWFGGLLRMKHMVQHWMSDQHKWSSAGCNHRVRWVELRSQTREENEEVRALAAEQHTPIVLSWGGGVTFDREKGTLHGCGICGVCCGLLSALAQATRNVSLVKQLAIVKAEWQAEAELSERLQVHSSTKEPPE
eukprot:3032531-Amphidinium_carterae.1